MRTIKFRGKTVKETTCHHRNEWSYGDLSTVDERTLIDNGMYYAEVKEETVGQFTGLFDKNGKEIYEGDIVKHPYIDPIFRDLVESKDGDGITSEVVFHGGAFCVQYDTNDFIYLDSFTRHKHVEVIGNIHDNPELLKD